MRTHLTACWRGGDETGVRPGYCLQWRYAEWVHPYLKRVVPAADREWRPETQVWWVAEGYEDRLESLFSNFKAIIFDQLRMPI